MQISLLHCLHGNLKLQLINYEQSSKNRLKNQL